VKIRGHVDHVRARRLQAVELRRDLEERARRRARLERADVGGRARAVEDAEAEPRRGLAGRAPRLDRPLAQLAEARRLEAAGLEGAARAEQRREPGGVEADVRLGVALDLDLHAIHKRAIEAHPRALEGSEVRGERVAQRGAIGGIGLREDVEH
jgi:hypothetical protein